MNQPKQLTRAQLNEYLLRTKQEAVPSRGSLEPWCECIAKGKESEKCPIEAHAKAAKQQASLFGAG